MADEKEKLSEEVEESVASSATIPAAKNTLKKSENSSLSPSNVGEKPKKAGKINRKKLWKTIAVVSLAVVCFVMGLGLSPFFMDEELLALMRIKQKIQEVYYEDIDDDRFYSTLFDAINNDLLDNYSEYMTTEEYAANEKQAKGQREGVGLTYATYGTQVYVNKVRGNSPAEEAGLKCGDKIVAYGTEPASMTVATSVDSVKAFVNAQPQNSDFYLSYERAGVLSVATLRNADFMENYVFYRTGDTSYIFTGSDALTPKQTSDPLTGLPQDTAYIRLTRFYGNAAEQFAAAMNYFKAAGKKNLVLDLRDNGGGYMEVLTKIGAFFCKGAGKSPTIAYAEYRGGKKEYFQGKQSRYDEYFTSDSQIYVLGDDGTASASECLIGCMVDYGALPFSNICLTQKGGTAKTYGKGIMQTTYAFWLGNTDGIRLTTATIKWPKSGRCIHGVGVTTADGCQQTEHIFGYDSEIYGGLSALHIL